MTDCDGPTDCQMRETFESFHWIAQRFKQLQHLRVDVAYLLEDYYDQLGFFKGLEIPGTHNFNGALKSMWLEFHFSDECINFDFDKMVESLGAHPDFCKLQWKHENEEFITGSYGKDETVEEEKWPGVTSDERLKKYLEKPKGEKRELDS